MKKAMYEAREGIYDRQHGGLIGFTPMLVWRGLTNYRNNGCIGEAFSGIYYIYFCANYTTILITDKQTDIIYAFGATGNGITIRTDSNRVLCRVGGKLARVDSSLFYIWASVGEIYIPSHQDHGMEIYIYICTLGGCGISVYIAQLISWLYLHS